MAPINYMLWLMSMPKGAKDKDNGAWTETNICKSHKIIECATIV